MSIANSNAGGSAAPALLSYFNLLALEDLPEWSAGPSGLDFDSQMEAIAAAGYDGIQFADVPVPEQVALCRGLGLRQAGSTRINTPDQASTNAARLRDLGLECATAHVAWGLEDDSEAFALIEAILEASEKLRFPIYLETHRATLFQDMWRTVRFVERYPDLRFNGDFSHWYAGLEMVYGGFDMKFAFIAPVLERVRFLHGRIASPGCIQVDIGEGTTASHPYVEHYRRLWTAAFRGFLASARAGDFICFAPELLAPRIYYARTFPDASGQMREEGDRWTQSLLLRRIARECFAAASNQL